MADTWFPVPPPTPRLVVTELYHGVVVADPYRWLEDGESQSTVEWVALQNERTRQALDAQPDRGRWHERLVALMSRPVVLQAKVRGNRLFVLERAPGAEQYALVLRSATDPAASAVTLVDPGASSADSATALDWFEPSSDGRLVAYGVSEGGTEESTLSILDVETGGHLPDSIGHTRAATVAWLADASGFYYTAYPAGDQYNRRVLYHRLGAGGDDQLVWSDAAAPQSWPDVHTSPDGRYLLVVVFVGWGRIDAFLLDRDDDTWTTVISGIEAMSSFGFRGDALLIATTADAPRGRVALAQLASASLDDWRTVVPEGADVISRASSCGDEILVVVTSRGVDRIERWSPNGQPLGPCAEFGVVSITGVAADPRADAALLVVAGFNEPAALYRYGPTTGVERWGGLDVSTETVPRLAVSQVSYPSFDGTSIGLFLIHREDVVPDAHTPTILNGYGGFAITETPLWSPMIAAWCAQGGLFAIAGLRGGLEEGEGWHHAGRREHKQNVFDDFHAAADWLVSSGRTSRNRLCIAGGSNGGLLVGAALTQRPDLCRAVWCAVPLLDMIRFPNFLIAKLWTDEYGDPDIAEEFGWLSAYSPYHHVVEGQHYPAVLLTTAEGDTRVDPLHARKMAAELQSAASDQDQRPILLLQAERAGHGVGKPAGKRADEAADVLAFFSWQLGIDR